MTQILSDPLRGEKDVKDGKTTYFSFKPCPIGSMYGIYMLTFGVC